MKNNEPPLCCPGCDLIYVRPHSWYCSGCGCTWAMVSRDAIMVTKKEVFESFIKADDAVAMWCILYAKAQYVGECILEHYRNSDHSKNDRWNGRRCK